jgi:tmRNA-binding protein
MKTISKIKYVDYNVIWSREAGLSLMGTEVKYIRLYKPTINNCYCVIIRNHIFIKNLFDRLIPLLLHKSEIKKIVGLYSKTRRILIIDHLYDNKSYIKVNFVVGEKMYREDKRKILIKKEEKRRMKNDF